MIQFFHVNKSYNRETDALQDVNLNVDRGEFVLLSGPSGAGKTTLLRLIFCEEQLSSGQLLVDGRNIAKLRPSQIPRYRREIGVVFQDFKLISTLTAAENVALAMDVRGIFGKRAKKRVSAMLNAVGLGHRLRNYPQQLSAGEQQRVAIARALINDPKILLADEPTGNLDQELTLEIMDLLEFINARGTTVVVATHNKELLEDRRKRILKLRAGKVSS